MVVFGCGLKGGEGVRLRRGGLEDEEARATLGIADLSLEFGLLFEFSFAELFGISEQETAQAPFVLRLGDLFGVGALFGGRDGGAVRVGAGFADHLLFIEGRGRVLLWFALFLKQTLAGDGMTEVGGGDAQDHGEGAGAANINLVGGQGLGELGKGHLDGVGVFERGQVEVESGLEGRLGAVDGVEVAEVVMAQGRGLAAVSVGENVPALVVHGGSFCVAVAEKRVAKSRLAKKRSAEKCARPALWAGPLGEFYPLCSV